jgi:hypothetical protein
MANPILTNNTYAGEYAGKYIAPAILNARTLAENNVELYPNIAFQTPMRPMRLTSIVKDATCDFVKNGDITLDERMLTPKQLGVNLDFCKNELMKTWEAVQMGYSQWKVIPKDFKTFLMGQVGASISEYIEMNMWDGTNVSDKFQGYYDLAENTAGTVPVTSTETEVNADNVLDELAKITDAIDNKLYSMDSKKLYLSTSFARAYVRALGGFGATGTGANGVDSKGTLWYNGQPLLYDGIPIAIANGLGSMGSTNVLRDRAMVSFKENLGFGTGLKSDMQKVQFIDMTPVDGSDNVRVIVKFSAGTQIGIPENVIYYKHA